MWGQNVRATKLANEQQQRAGLARGGAAALAMRKDQGAQKLVMAVLKTGSRRARLRDQAICAGELGDPSRCATRSIAPSFATAVSLAKVLKAAAALGGDEAQRYLEFVAQEHSDAQIRDEAKTALGHLLSAKARQRVRQSRYQRQWWSDLRSGRNT